MGTRPDGRPKHQPDLAAVGSRGDRAAPPRRARGWWPAPDGADARPSLSGTPSTSTLRAATWATVHRAGAGVERDDHVHAVAGIDLADHAVSGVDRHGHRALVARQSALPDRVAGRLRSRTPGAGVRGRGPRSPTLLLQLARVGDRAVLELRLLDVGHPVEALLGDHFAGRALGHEAARPRAPAPCPSRSGRRGTGAGRAAAQHAAIRDSSAATSSVPPRVESGPPPTRRAAGGLGRSATSGGSPYSTSTAAQTSIELEVARVVARAAVVRGFHVLDEAADDLGLVFRLLVALARHGL